MDKSYLSELTEAEKGSIEIVRFAQIEREKRVKEAKADAEQELKETRDKMESEYQAAATQLLDHLSGANDMRSTYEREVEEVRQMYNENSKEALDFLVSRVLQIDIKVPEVVKGKFS